MNNHSNSNYFPTISLAVSYSVNTKFLWFWLLSQVFFVLQLWLSWNSDRSHCPCLLSAVITGGHHHCLAKPTFNKLSDNKLTLLYPVFSCFRLGYDPAPHPKCPCSQRMADILSNELEV